MAKIRVFLADDHAIVRTGLQLMIQAQPDMEVVGQAGTIRELVQEAQQTSPDVISLDLQLPDGSGLKAVAPLRAACPHVKFLVLTAQNDAAYAHATLAEGVNGYVAKSLPEAELLSAIRAVHQHRIVIKLDLADGAMGALPAAGALGSTSLGLDCLGSREREVFELLAYGFTNQQVADRLFLSVKTVETHRSRLAAKLGLRDRADLIRYAIEVGVLKTPGTGRE